MTTAQPGQEQTMETKCNCRELPHHPLCLEAARPTADLGEDGDADWLRNLVKLRFASERTDIGDRIDRIAERLILYREALEQIAAVDAPLGPDTQNLVTHIARAVLSRSGG